MTQKTDATQLRDLARLRRVSDRIDREYRQPLDVEALARGVHMSAGHLEWSPKLAVAWYPPRGPSAGPGQSRFRGGKLGAALGDA